MVTNTSVAMNNDTIVAIATPHGVGGIAVLRISGPRALEICLSHLSVESLAPHRATYCHFLDAEGQFVDDGIAIFYPSRHSYTGEETVELSCHGSRYTQQALLESLLQSGARMAEAGEFTLRAFLGGRMNLSQAEAVADLIDAVTPAQHRLAVSQLRGGYAERLKELRQQLLDITSLLELELDFSQEDVEFAERHEIRRLIATLDSQITSLLDSFAAGNALKNGIPVAIVGLPNAGKSSLLNALLSDDRAIVSPQAGTTRDTIEELLTIDGITFRIIDTAGLREGADSVEAEGVARSLRAVQQAQLVLYVHDNTQPFVKPAIPLDNKTVLFVGNKADLSAVARDGWIMISARQRSGIEALRRAMVAAVEPLMKADNDVMLCNVRHRDAMLRVKQALKAADEGIATLMPSDLVAVDLRDALYHLGTITGDVTSDDVLGNIFSRFCIGK